MRNVLSDTPAAKADGVQTTIYVGANRKEVRADMVLHEPKIDAALLKLRGDDVWHGLARVLRPDQACRVKVWDTIYAVGCPLGNDLLNGTNSWMINAPTYFGNSGGGVYRADTRELIGVFSKICTHGKGNPVAIPHMGLCTPIATIHDWLGKEKMGWVLEGGEVSVEAAAPMK